MAVQPAVDTWPAIGVAVESQRDVGKVQRLAAGAAARQGLPPARAELVEQLAVHVATFLVGQETVGRVVVRTISWGERRGVEIVVSAGGRTPFEVDGLRDLVDASDLVEVYTAPGKGTVMLAQLWGGPQTEPADRRFLIGSVVDPIEGESVSGDAWAVEQRGGRIAALVTDGLGHGAKATEASEAAVAVFRARYREPVELIAAGVHDALRGTRGAAIALVEVDKDAGELRFCGIGNIVARVLLAGGAHELVSRYGIAGYQSPRIHTVTQSWSDDAMLVLHSDGLSSRWNVDAYPRLRLQHPQLAASTLMRDATRAPDDAMVIAIGNVAEATLERERATA